MHLNEHVFVLISIFKLLPSIYKIHSTSHTGF